MGTAVVGAEGAAAWLAGRRRSRGLGSPAGHTPGSRVYMSHALLAPLREALPGHGQGQGQRQRQLSLGSGAGGAETETPWAGSRVLSAPEQALSCLEIPEQGHGAARGTGDTEPCLQLPGTGLCRAVLLGAEGPGVCSGTRWHPMGAGQPVQRSGGIQVTEGRATGDGDRTGALGAPGTRWVWQLAQRAGTAGVWPRCRGCSPMPGCRGMGGSARAMLPVPLCPSPAGPGAVSPVR